MGKKKQEKKRQQENQRANKMPPNYSRRNDNAYYRYWKRGAERVSGDCVTTVCSASWFSTNNTMQIENGLKWLGAVYKVRPTPTVLQHASPNHDSPSVIGTGRDARMLRVRSSSPSLSKRGMFRLGRVRVDPALKCDVKNK